MPDTTTFATLPLSKVAGHVGMGPRIVDANHDTVANIPAHGTHAERELFASNMATRYNNHERLANALRNLLANAEAIHSFGLSSDIPPLTAVCFSDAQTEARDVLASID
jgi:hypothetical protein